MSPYKAVRKLGERFLIAAQSYGCSDFFSPGEAQASKSRDAPDPLTVFAQPRRKADLKRSLEEGPECIPKPPFQFNATTK